MGTLTSSALYPRLTSPEPLESCGTVGVHAGEGVGTRVDVHNVEQEDVPGVTHLDPVRGEVPPLEYEPVG